MSFRSRIITLVVQPVSHQAGPSKLSRPALAPTLAQLRSYATHKEAPRKNGPSASATAAQEAYVYGTTTGPRVKSTFEGTERVGPFPLGVGSSGRDQTWKSWRELTLGGKLGRTVRQSGNLGIILFGSGLLIVLTLSLTTELFATNSPGVLYSQAVDKIRKSDALNPHLLPPLSFTHSPRAAAPVRGTTPVIHRTVKHPSSGRDHMIITFWVHGRGKEEPERLGWFKDTYASVEQSIKDLAVYAGLIEPSNTTAASSPSSLANAATVPDSQAAPAHGGSSNWLSGLFGAVTGRSSSTGSGGLSSSTRGLPPPGTYTVGEVHGDYVKNAAGEYQLLSLIIDIPSSGASYPGRAVVHWSPEADKEGILSKIGSRGR